jgi:hypothetical protein
MPKSKAEPRFVSCWNVAPSWVLSWLESVFEIY